MEKVKEKPIRNLFARIDEQVYLKMKMYCFENDITNEQFINNAVSEKLEREINKNEDKDEK